MAKQFQYEIQEYQEDCINNIVSIFDEIWQNRDFQQVITEHHEQNNYHFPTNKTKNIDIMMETGTGKTFTFIKTMFELNKKFGYKKFIILIPTVAIREGTKANLEDTKEYFKGIYANEREKEIEVFVYESGKLSTVGQFISNPDKFSVLVMTPSSFNSDNNLLNKPLERDINLFNRTGEVPKNYLECLKMLNPIIIMDEPHKFKGDAFLTYFEGFNNYFLRFGATFPKASNDKRIVPLSNVAYTLDSISAFRQSLVKKIVVYTQDVVSNAQILLGIENKKAIVNSLHNGIFVKEELGIGKSFNGQIIRKINANDIVLSNGDSVKVDYNLSDEALRQMIRTTINIHFEKEQTLFDKGIKALTLFFMESDIAMFRGENPKIKTIFEEEYADARTIALSTATGKYLEYLQNDYDENSKLRVHEGYFSGDKGNTDEKIKQGVDLILKNKKKLLSLENPIRFIFSIWALQEGWDNPNVFTICKLSNQGSEISKLQQIGRGLRICVNQNLERNTISKFADNEDDFWAVNNLDVVVSDKEVGFVEAIQKEILDNSFSVNETFTEVDLKKVLKEKANFDDATVRSLFKRLENKEMIVFKEIIDGNDVFEKSPNYSVLLKEQTDLPPEQYKVLENLFADVKNYVQNANNRRTKRPKVCIKQSHIVEFKKLWNTINRQSFYTIDNLDDKAESELAKQIADEIAAINIDAVLLQTIRRELVIKNLEGSDAIKQDLKETETLRSKIDYLEFVRQLSGESHTPISFIIKIFNALPSDFKSKMISNNPAQALKEMKDVIEKNLMGSIKARIEYNAIDGHISSNELHEESGIYYLNAGSCGKFQEDISCQFSLKEKWIFEDVIEYDSDTEKVIILQDPEVDSIELFGKLPRLKIKTPLGDYNPDFCYTIKGNNGKNLFLIVESKGYDTVTKIPPKEKEKIDFAKKHFEKLNELYKNSNIEISYRERINTTQLAQLVNDIINQ